MTTTDGIELPTLTQRLNAAQNINFWTEIYLIELMVFAVVSLIGAIYNSSLVCIITAVLYAFVLFGICDWWQDSVERELIHAYNDVVRSNDKDLEQQFKKELRKK